MALIPKIALLTVFMLVGLASALTYVGACADLNVPNEVYVLTADLTGNMSDGRCLDVLADNIMVNCNGYNITGNASGTTYGINIAPNNVTIENCTISNYTYGVSLLDALYCNITNNTVYDNGNAGFWISGNSDSNNLMNNRAYSNSRGIQLESGADYNSLANNTAYDNLDGIYIESDYNNLTNNTVYSNSRGIHLRDSLNNNLTGNTAYTNSDGFYLIRSNNSNLANNTIYENSHGIELDVSSNYNNIGGNEIHYNSFGLYLIGSSNNTLTDNKICNNWNFDIFLTSDSGDNDGDNTCDDVLGSDANTVTCSVSCPSIPFVQGTCGQVINEDVTLTQDILDCPHHGIMIRGDNVTLDCNGHSISGLITDYDGVRVYNRTGVTIKNCYISNFNYGIYFRSVRNSWAYHNTVWDCAYTGIYLGYSDCYDNIIQRNNVSSCTSYGIRTTGATYDNLIFDNALSSNGDNAEDVGGNNLWNGSYNCAAGPNIIGGTCIGGNYYNDYFGVDDGSGPYPHDVAGDGIGDDPPYYPIQAGPDTRDYLPLTSDYGPPTYITDCTTITSSGKYILSNDIIGNMSNGRCIDINTDNVMLDCENHKITSDSTGTTRGVYVGGDDYAIVKNCEISDYRYGIYFRSVYSGMMESNTINNCDYGLYLGYSGCDENIINGNVVTGSSNYGIRLTGTPMDNYLTNNEVSDGGGVGIYVAADDTTLDTNKVHNNTIGIDLSSSSSSILLDNTAYGNSQYALRSVNSDLDVTGMLIYEQTQYLYVSGATNNFTDLTLGYSKTCGLINWQGLLSLTTVEIIHNTNIFLNNDFVSLNASDPNVAEFNVPANLTTRVGGCNSLKYYNDTADEFPQSTAEILANGVTFTPAASACAGTRATYEVDGFSGYMAAGSSPGGGSSLDSMSLFVSSNPTVGETVTITVKDSGNPLSGANVKVRVKIGGIYEYYDLGKTNSAGEVTFTPEHAGNYKAMAEKSGYFDEEKYFTVESAEGVPECTEDADCAVGFNCVSGKCTKAQPPEEEPADTGPAGIECVSNMDCPEGYICEENLCIEDVIEEEPEGGPTDEVATQAIYEAEQAINKAKDEGKDTSEAEACLVLAEQAYAAGDYQAAVDAANEAKTLAEHATVPAAAPTEPTTVPEVISEPVAPEEPAAPVEESPLWIWVILGVVIIAALAYWFFIRK